MYLSKTLIATLVVASLASCSKFKELAGLDVPTDPTVRANSAGLWEGFAASGQPVFLVLSQTGNTVAGRIGGVVKGNSSYGIIQGDTITLNFDGSCPGSVVTGQIKEPLFTASVLMPCAAIDETIVLFLDR